MISQVYTILELASVVTMSLFAVSFLIVEHDCGLYCPQLNRWGRQEGRLMWRGGGGESQIIIGTSHASSTYHVVLLTAPLLNWSMLVGSISKLVDIFEREHQIVSMILLMPCFCLAIHDCMTVCLIMNDLFPRKTIKRRQACSMKLPSQVPGPGCCLAAHGWRFPFKTLENSHTAGHLLK